MTITDEATRWKVEADDLELRISRQQEINGDGVHFDVHDSILLMRARMIALRGCAEAVERSQP